MTPGGGASSRRGCGRDELEPQQQRAGTLAPWAWRRVPGGRAEFGPCSLSPGRPRSGRAGSWPAASRAADARHAAESWGGGLRRGTRTRGAVRGLRRNTHVTICLTGAQGSKPSPRRIQLLLLKGDSGGNVTGGSTSPSVTAEGASWGWRGDPWSLGNRQRALARSQSAERRPRAVPCHPSQTTPPPRGTAVGGGRG